MNALWYTLPITVVGLIVIFMMIGLRFLYKENNPPVWIQLAFIAPFMVFSFRYWYLPIDIAAGMFSGVYDPVYNMFPGMASGDLIPCTDNEYKCSVLYFDYPKHVAWTIALFDGYTFHPWIPKFLRFHVLFNAIAICLLPWQLWLMKNEKVDTHRIVGRIIGVSAVIGTSMGWLISIRAHGATEAYGGVLSILAFGSMWAGVVAPLTLGYIFIKKKDIVNHKKWMIRFFGALFGSYFFWRIEALVLQWMFSSINGWLFYTVTSWFFGIILFDYAAKKSGFYLAERSNLDAAIS